MVGLALILLAGLLAACEGTKPSTGPEDSGDTGAPTVCDRTWFTDADTDGFGDRAAPLVACRPPEGAVEDATDCDDGDSDVHPDAEERCDGLDNDCDGRVDDADGDVIDPSTWYADADGDGAGVEAFSTTACEAPDGYAAQAGDCDDDDDDEGGVPVWYTDGDGDGHGTDERASRACEAPEGTVREGGDCDDADASVHPGAEERCDDGLDTDCDGDPSDGDGVDATTWYPDADGDGWGDAAGGVSSCAPVEGALELGLDCDDGDDSVNPDAEERCGDGIDQDCDGGPGDCGLTGDVEIASAEIVLTAEVDGDYLGTGVSGGVDVDGDGYDDVALGAAVGSYVPILRGPLSTMTVGEDAADAVWTGTRGSYLGRSLAWVGDVDGDGAPELASGANDADFESSAGALYLLSGEVAGAHSVRAEALAWSGRPGDRTADAVASVGDTDGDGVHEACTGSPGAGTSEGGQAYLLRGPITASGVLVDADTVFSGQVGDQAGCDVASAGDWDGDGLDDLLVGAGGADDDEHDGGSVYVISGLADGEISAASASVLAVALGPGRGDGVGCVIAGPGDLDGDGGPDLVLSGEDTRAIYEVRGPFTGTMDLDYAEAIWSTPTQPSAAAPAGDVDGDGWTDVLVGDGGHDDDNGRVVLLGGPLVEGAHDLAETTARVVGADVRAQVGWAVSTAGDTDGDGYDDVIIGAYGSAESWVLLGGGL